jgi:hypothetical protein
MGRHILMSEESGLVINLTPWEYDFAYQIGIRRYVENWGKADASYYDKSKMEEDRNAQPAAAICELAVAKYTNQYWNMTIWDGRKHKQYKDIPDVGHNIEVRRVRTASGPAVRDKDLGRGLIVWGAIVNDVEYRSVELLGYIDADKGYEIGVEARYGKIIPREILIKPWEKKGGK